MNPTIYLSCLLVIIFGILVMPARAQTNQEFVAERTRLIKIFNPSVHEATKMRHYPDLMEFYGKYRDRLTLTYENRKKVDEEWRKYMKGCELVEGVCLQGVWWIYIPAIAEIILEQTGILSTTKPTNHN